MPLRFCFFLFLLIWFVYFLVFDRLLGFPPFWWVTGEFFGITILASVMSVLGEVNPGVITTIFFDSTARYRGFAWTLGAPQQAESSTGDGGGCGMPIVMIILYYCVSRHYFSSRECMWFWQQVWGWLF